MRAFVVPWTVFSPVGGGDFFPRVIKCVLGGENFHCRVGTTNERSPLAIVRFLFENGGLKQRIFTSKVRKKAKGVVD